MLGEKDVDGARDFDDVVEGVVVGTKEVVGLDVGHREGI